MFSLVTLLSKSLFSGKLDSRADKVANAVPGMAAFNAVLSVLLPYAG